MSSIVDDVRAAREMGLTYGKYKALTYDPNQASTKAPSKKSRRAKQKRFKDEDAFTLWQHGKTDAEIASSVGVCRSRIQLWRDTLELPSAAKTNIDTKKYHLAKMQDGTYIVTVDQEL